MLLLFFLCLKLIYLPIQQNILQLLLRQQSHRELKQSIHQKVFYAILKVLDIYTFLSFILLHKNQP